MNLAFLTHEPFHPPSGGGSAEAVYLVQELVRRGHTVHVFGPALPDADAVQRRFNIRLHPFTTWEMGRYARLRNLKYVAYPFFLERLVRRVAQTERFDLILSQHAISAVAAGRLGLHLGVPVVMNFLDYLTGFMETWPRLVMPPPVLRRLERFEVSLPVRYRADGVMTVSDTLADHFAHAGHPRERMRPIYYGYDADLFPWIEPPVAAPGPPAAPTIVMHGSFDRHHLGPVAAGAIARIHAERPDVGFRFVGRETPTLRQFVEAARAASPGVRVECTGFVPYTEMAARLRDATVGIVPYEESTGTHCAFVAKIVEYAGLGLPVVSTPLDSASRYFAREPLIRFTAFDAAKFAQGVLRWLDEPVAKRVELGRAASGRVRAALDWRALGRNAIDFVEQIQQQRAGQRPA